MAATNAGAQIAAGFTAQPTATQVAWLTCSREDWFAAPEAPSERALYLAVTERGFG